MNGDKFDPKTKKDLLNENQKSFMSDTVDEPSSSSGNGTLLEKFCSCLTISHYKQYFDVTQDQIVSRITRSLFPFSGSPLFENGKVDLYGPLWVFITLNISMAVFGYMSVYIDHVYSNVSLIKPLTTPI